MAEAHERPQGEMETWKNERPSWCPHGDCAFLRRAQDAICAGKMPAPVPHDADFNTHRLCLNGALPNGEVFDLQVNTTDLYQFRRIFDAIDGRGVGSRCTCGAEINMPYLHQPWCPVR